MNASVRIAEAEGLLGDIEDFRFCCAHHAWFLDFGIIELPTAADNLQWLAERWGLVDVHGQDAIQAEMASALTVLSDEIPLAPLPEPPKRIYRTPKSVIDAFEWVACNKDAKYLARWLKQHPRDAPYLLKIWERKNAFA